MTYNNKVIYYKEYKGKYEFNFTFRNEYEFEKDICSFRKKIKPDIYTYHVKDDLNRYITLSSKKFERYFKEIKQIRKEKLNEINKNGKNIEQEKIKNAIKLVKRLDVNYVKDNLRNDLILQFNDNGNTCKFVTNSYNGLYVDNIEGWVKNKTDVHYVLMAKLKKTSSKLH